MLQHGVDLQTMKNKYSKEELLAIKKVALTQDTKMPKVSLETHQSQKYIVG